MMESRPEKIKPPEKLIMDQTNKQRFFTEFTDQNCKKDMESEFKKYTLFIDSNNHSPWLEKLIK